MGRLRKVSITATTLKEQNRARPDPPAVCTILERGTIELRPYINEPNYEACDMIRG